MSCATVDDLHLWINKMMDSLNITDYKMDVGGNNTKGEGYLGEVTFLKVAARKNGIKADYDLVVKSAKKSDQLRKQTPVKDAYDRETLFYSKIFPAFETFQKEKNVEKSFRNVPKCYSFSKELTKEAVVLQNLKTIGFELHDRKQAMNLNHILLVFQNYGKYHALSIALRHKKPKLFNTLTRNMTDVLAQFIIQTNMMKVFYDEFDNVKALLKRSNKTEVLNKFEGFEKDFEKFLIHSSNDNAPLSVLVHGDCWNNNYMFKYEGKNKSKPVDMCFLDFQLIRISSPIVDLSYFLYSCADKISLKNFDFILQAYYSSLTDFLCELGCDPNIAFTFKQLKESWKEHGRYGLMLSLFLIKISICDATEAPDLMETANKGESIADSLQLKLQNEDVYNERILDVYLHFAEKFL